MCKRRILTLKKEMFRNREMDKARAEQQRGMQIAKFEITSSNKIERNTKTVHMKNVFSFLRHCSQLPNEGVLPKTDTRTRRKFTSKTATFGRVIQQRNGRLEGRNIVPCGNFGGQKSKVHKFVSNKPV